MSSVMDFNIRLLTVDSGAVSGNDMGGFIAVIDTALPLGQMGSRRYGFLFKH